VARLEATAAPAAPPAPEPVQAAEPPKRDTEPERKPHWINRPVKRKAPK